MYRELADISPPVPGTLEVQNADWLEVRQVLNRSVIERLQTEARLEERRISGNCSGSRNQF